MNIKKRYKLLWTIGLFLLIGGVFLSGFTGSADIEMASIINILKHKLLNINVPGINASDEIIIWNLRMPRALMALFIGGGLALSGVVMQALTQNVLAEPYIVGVQSGALACVTFLYFIGASFIYSWAGRFMAAFFGALITLLSVYKISHAGMKVASSRLILAGMAISTLLAAVSNFFIIATPNSNIIKGILSWTMGSVSSARWNNILFPGITIGLCSLYVFFNAKKYDVISLGDDTALSLGVNIQKLKKRSIILVSLMAGVSVASCGIIGFVGFIVPHILRRLISPKHIYLLPLSFIYGACFLCLCDILARTIFSPQELPIGIITALLGAPIFIYLLLKEKI